MLNKQGGSMKNKWFYVLSILVCVSINANVHAISYEYEFVGASWSTTGDSSWDIAILEMTISINNNGTATSIISKIDDGDFTDKYTPYMYLQKDSFETWAKNLASARLYAVPSITLVSSKPLHEYSWPDDNILFLYGRYENSEGKYAWVGPVKIRRKIKYEAFSAPRLKTPINNDQNISISIQNLSWYSVTGEAGTPSYRILLAKDYSFSDFVSTTDGGYCKSNNTCKSDVTTSCFYNGFSLDYGTTYYWKVRAGNSNAGGKWSDIRSFTTENQVTYRWKEGNWGNCNTSCGNGKQARSVQCIREDTNAVVNDSFCSSLSKPSTSKDCQSYTYEWIKQSWSNCNTECGTGYQSRNVFCRRCDSIEVNESYCQSSAKPSTQQQCQGTNCPECDRNHLNLCKNSSNCSLAGGYWYNNTCNAQEEPPECDSSHLNLCNSSNCSSAGGHWYNNKCNAQEEPPECDSSHLYLCNSSNCSTAGGYWYNSSCNAQEQPPECDSGHLYLCNSSNCSSFGGYWYNNTCNSQPETPKCDSQHLNLCNSSNCSSVGGYWYNNSCNTSEPPVDDPIEIFNDTIISDQISVDQKKIYYIQVPDSATVLIIKTENVVGDLVDLYVKKDQKPDLDDFNARSFSGKGNELLRIDASGADGKNGINGELTTNYSLTIGEGRYYIMVHSAKTSGSFSLKAIYLELNFPFTENNWHVTQGYGPDACDFENNPTITHCGIGQRYSLDFAQGACDSYGIQILAAEKGVVNVNTFSNAYGNNVVIDHGDGYKTLYAHLATVSVRNGITVQRGQEIGTCGDTGHLFGEACKNHPGTHLHFSFLRETVGRKPEPLSSDTDIRYNQQKNGHNINNPSKFIIIDDTQAIRDGESWQTKDEGYLGHMQYLTGTGKTQSTGTMTWQFNIPESDNYVVYAHIPKQKSTASVTYTIHHANGESDSDVNQSLYNNQWVRISPESGYQFKADEESYVKLNNANISAGLYVGFDAIMFTAPEWGSGGQIDISIPSDLTANESESGIVILQWQAPQGTISDNYKIYRNDIFYDSVPGSILNYQDTQVQEGVEYTYYVTSIVGENESGKSNSIVIKISGDLNLPDDWKTFEASNFKYQLMITTELFGFDKQKLIEPSDILGAFVQGECRGFAIPSDGPNGKLYYLQVWSSITSGEMIHFRYYNSNDQTETMINTEPIPFEPDQSIGSVASPYRIEMKPIIEQEIQLSKGWNWISLQIIPEDNDLSLSSVLDAIKENSSRIVSQKQGFSEYYNGWYGTVQTLDVTSMYMLKMKNDCTLRIKGQPINLAETKIHLNKNWNWISYLISESSAVNEALQPLEENGERIVGQSGFAEFYNGWWGGLTILEPGRGYKLKMKNEFILTYVESQQQKRTRKLSLRKNKYIYSFNPADFEYQGTIIATVDYGNLENDFIAAFYEDKCRGVGEFIKTSAGDRVFLQLWSNSVTGEELKLKYYHSGVNKLFDIDSLIEFTSNMEVGSIKSPKQLSPPDIRIKGDLNNDDQLNLRDVILILKTLSNN